MASPYKHSASERVSARKSPQARKAGPVTKKVMNTPKKGATVGDAINAVSKAVGDTARGVNSNIHGALKKTSPGLQSKGIDNVMKLPAKKKTR